MRLPTIQEAMTVAAYQAPLLSGGTMAIGLIATQVKECEAAGVEILCCPEAVLGGLADYNRRPDDFAIDARGGQLRAVLAPIASRTVTTIVGFTEAGAEGRLFNSAAVVSEGEVVGVYRKRHPAINRSVYDPGMATPIFKVGGLVFGIAICRDSTFPELARGMVTGGATALFIPTNNAFATTKSGADVVEYARKTDVGLAKANRAWVIRADVAGRADDLESYGSSGIVAPDGCILQSAEQLEPELLIAEIAIPTKYVRYVNAARVQPSALSRNFFAKCKEVTDKRFIHLAIHSPLVPARNRASRQLIEARLLTAGPTRVTVAPLLAVDVGRIPFDKLFTATDNYRNPKTFRRIYMSNYRRLLSGAAILAILVVAAISFNYRQVEAQGPGGAPVIIQNPLPLPVRDVDVAARIPFNIVFRFLGDFGPIHTVPNDRRMTIEFVSALCRNTLAQSPGLQVSLSTRVGGTLAEHRLDPRLLESFGFNVYSVSNVVRIYADPGTEVRATAVGNTPGDCSITLSGFLEQVPTRG